MKDTHSTDLVRVLASGTCRVGFAKSELPLVDGMSMFGHSLVGQIGKRGTDRLWARSLFWGNHGGDDQGVFLVFVDLWSASLPLWQAVAELAGVPKQSLVLFGTHTHTAPGRYVGSSFYELFAGRIQVDKLGFSREWTQALAYAIAVSVRKAVRNARDHNLVFTRTSVWNAGRNRSQVAFERNAEVKAGLWNTPGYPGESPPAGLQQTQRSIDPRLDSIVAVDSRGAAAAIFSFFGCHATALGPLHKLYDRDWPGRAVDAIEAEGPFGAIGLSGAGDVTPLRPDDDAAKHQGPELAQETARRVAEGMRRSFKAAEQEPTRGPLSFDVTNGVWEPRLRYRWEIGNPAMAGAEDGRSHLPEWIAKEGKTRAHPDPSNPQSPKSSALGCLQELARDIAPLDIQPYHPWHRVRLGAHVIQTVPLEPTGMAAFRLGTSLRKMLAVETATIAGYSGDYAGYLTTEEEYDSQQYEGGSTLYGRHSLDDLIATLMLPASDSAMTMLAHDGDLGPAVKRMLRRLETRPFVATTLDGEATDTVVAIWVDGPESSSKPALSSDTDSSSPIDVVTIPWPLPDGRRLRAARFVVKHLRSLAPSPPHINLRREGE